MAASRANEILDIIHKSEGCADPFMMRYHVISDDLEKRWGEYLSEAFKKYLDSLTDEEYAKVKSRTQMKFG